MKLREGQHPKIFINSLLLVLVLGIISGQYISLTGNRQLIFGLIIFGMLMAGGILLHYRSKYIALVLLAVMLLLGIMRTSSCLGIGDKDILHWADQEITFSGELAEDPVLRQGEDGELHIKYVVGNITILRGGIEEKCENKIIVYARANSFGELQQLPTMEVFPFEQYGRVGDKIQGSGQLRRLHNYQNPGQLDTVMANYAKGIHGQLSASKYSISLTKQSKSYLNRLAGDIRHKYKSAMDEVMPPTDSGAIFAMLFGGYGGIKPELLEAFTVTGLIHILSVSGSHITLMAGVAEVTGKVLGLSNRVTAVLATVIIILYSLLAGLVIPVVRSAIMGILTILALTLGQERDAQHVLSITALGILLLWPLSLFDISFQLSFGATAGLLYLSPKIRKILAAKVPYFIAGNLAVTIGAQLAVLPFLAWYFNVVSLSSLLANLVVAPLVELIIVISLLAGIMVGLVPILGKLIFMCSSLLLGMAYELSRLIAQLPGSQLYLPTMSKAIWGAYYGVLAARSLPKENQEQVLRKFKQFVKLSGNNSKYVGGAVSGIIIVGLILYSFQPKEMTVHFIDVGQGDAALIITPHGQAFMVDTGGNRQGSYDIGKRVDVPYLLHYGVRRLEFILLTHAHDDHAKGVAGILGKIPVGTVLIGHEGQAVYRKTFGESNPAVGQESYGVLQEGTEMSLDGVRIQVLYAPVENTTGGSTGNEFSNLIRVSYGQHSFLFTGDLSADHEKVVLERGIAVESTVLKVGHHGSNTSSSTDFLQAVKPHWSVISVGYGNNFGHPKPEIVQRLARYTKQKIFRTDKHGAVVFRTDGQRIRVEPFAD